MLVLSRKTSEGLLLDGRIRVCVLSIRGTRVKLGIEAPDDVEVVRDELLPGPPTRRGSCIDLDLGTSVTSARWTPPSSDVIPS